MPHPRDARDRPISLGELAARVRGDLEGSSELPITGVALPHEATAGDLTLVDKQPTLDALDEPNLINAGAVIVPSDYRGSRRNVIRVDNPRLAFAKAIELFHPRRRADPVISPTASIHPSAVIGEGVNVGDGCCIGENVTIGAGTTLHCRIVVHHATVIGERVVVQSGAVIGGEGFGQVADGERFRAIPHVGRVRIEDDVWIGANATIDRANLGETHIANGAFLGPAVHIGHNAAIGPHTRVVAQAGIAGNCRIGEHVLIGGQAGIAQGVEVGDHAVIGPKATVIANVATGERVYGSPGMPLWAWLRSARLIPKLSGLRAEVRRLRRRG
ncbi:MAG: UDP-3-O-(3-hydroxymyristoyl)glucosamine N-acyltransferase [Planctomycetota bacterium]